EPGSRGKGRTGASAAARSTRGACVVSEVVFQAERDGITDAEWQELLARASGEGRYFFTENQLYLAYARNKVKVTRYISRSGVHGARDLISEATLNEAGREYLPEEVACLVIVEHDALVDLLLKNGAHQELSALIVAESGYPEALASEARRLLDARADLKVIA